MPFHYLAEAEEFESRTVTRMLFVWEEATVQSGNIVNIPLKVHKMLYFAEQTGAFCSLGRLYPWTAQADAEVLTLAKSCKGRSNTIEVNRFKLIENKKRVGSRQQRVVVVGGEFHSTDGFSEAAGRGLAYFEYSTESVAGLRERRHQGSRKGKQGCGERSRRRFLCFTKKSAQQQTKARTRKTLINAWLFK